MGTWGTKIYDDDCSLDVRDEFMKLKTRGRTTEQIEASILADFIDKDYPDGNDVTYLALCCIELETGTLTDQTKEKALEIITSGRQVDFWQKEASDEEAEHRKQELETIKTIIDNYGGSPVENDDWKSLASDYTEIVAKSTDAGDTPKGAIGILYRIGYGLGYLCLAILVLYGLYLLFGQST